MRTWQAEILAWHATNGCSNRLTEAINLLSKMIKPVGHGFRNFPTIGDGYCCTAASPGRFTEREIARPLSALGGVEPGNIMRRDAEVQAATLPGPSTTSRLHYCPWA